MRTTSAFSGAAASIFDPVVSLDLDLVVALEQIERAEALLAAEFTVKRFPHSINVDNQLFFNGIDDLLRGNGATSGRKTWLLPRARRR